MKWIECDPCKGTPGLPVSPSDFPSLAPTSRLVRFEEEPPPRPPRPPRLALLRRRLRHRGHRRRLCLLLGHRSAAEHIRRRSVGGLPGPRAAYSEGPARSQGRREGARSRPRGLGGTVGLGGDVLHQVNGETVQVQDLILQDCVHERSNKIYNTSYSAIHLIQRKFIYCVTCFGAFSVSLRSRENAPLIPLTRRVSALESDNRY